LKYENKIDNTVEKKVSSFRTSNAEAVKSPRINSIILNRANEKNLDISHGGVSQKNKETIHQNTKAKSFHTDNIKDGSKINNEKSVNENYPNDTFDKLMESHFENRNREDDAFFNIKKQMCEPLFNLVYVILFKF
jgi:hypothetical protein